MLKTFWGWRDMQLPDGTVIWLLPDGHTYVTTPGSALLFPNLCAPTGDAPAASPGPHRRSEDREVMMPRRSSTRAQNRAKRIIAERRHNRLATQAAEAQAEYVGAHDTPELPPDPDEPPPF